MIRKSSALLIVLIVASFVQVQAQFNVSGALQAWLYAWENPNQNQQVDYYQGFQFKVGNDGYRNLTFKTYFQMIYRGDPAEWNSRAYNFLLDWKSDHRAVNVLLGRQFVYNGVINGTIDGVSVSYRPSAMWTFKAIAGINAPYDREFKLQSWEDSNSLGAYFSVRPSDYAKIDLSYFQRANSEETIWQQMGASVNGMVVKNLFYSAYYYHNLLLSEYQGIRFRLNYNFNPWDFSVEYNDQKPRIYEDSFFRIFELNAYSQVRSQVNYQLGNYQLGLQHLYSMYENGDNDNQLIFTVNGFWGTAGVLYQDGWGGKNVGGYGDVRIQLMEDLEARLFASVYNYQRQTMEITEDAVSYSLGLNYRLLSNLYIRAEAQQASNSYYKSDWRGLMFINFAFN